MEKKYTCCVLGHSSIKETENLGIRILRIIENLILNENVDTFLFGSKSKFNSLSLEAVTKAKEKYPHVKRIYVRAEFPYINDDYKNFLLEKYEDTYYPERILGAGKAVYVERNCEMINNSAFCIIYYDDDYTPSGRKSGTKIALDYAVKKGKHIIKLP